MSAKVFDSHFEAVSSAEAKEPRNVWPGVAICGFVGSGMCFAIGLVFSALTELGVIAASTTTAYITVAVLLAAFALAFVGAHAIDRNRSAAK